MSIKFEKIVPGMKLYTTVSYGMGNTTMRSLAVRVLTVLSVDTEKRTIQAKLTGGCYGDATRTVYERELKNWSTTKPLLVEGFCGRWRKASAEEKKLWKEGKLDKVSNQSSGYCAQED
jgi:hypothetical protein